MNTANADTVTRAGGHDLAFLGTVALVFAFTAVLTIHGCQSMLMPGMRMPGQTWPGVAAGFTGMWIAMMVAMMLPSQVPMLWRYRRALHRVGEFRLGRLTTLVSVGYFAVWSVAAVPAFALGVALTGMPARFPAAGVALLMSGLLQLTDWKVRRLACCRAAPGPDRTLPVSAGAAWRYGLRHGIHCGCCCSGATVVLVAVGAMDLRAMALTMLAITAERLVPQGRRCARAIGVACIAAGLLLIQRSCA